jgi:hypothetical protein
VKECTHPKEKRRPGTERAARRWGTAPTEICECGAWRMVIRADGLESWHTDQTIAEWNEKSELD